jgi:hypothetical protein
MVRSPLRTAALAALAVLSLCVPGFVQAPAAAALSAPSAAHPFSNPIWYPIHAKVYLDCVLTNPGCEGTHSDWTMDLVRETLPVGGAEGDIGVYAMGAGRLFVGDPSGSPCANTGTSNFGTWVWIDHGGGVVSRYGHFANIAVPNGTLVVAGQRIGTMGTTGKGGNCAVPYVDFQVRHHGVGGPRVEMKTLKVCSSETRNAVEQWPADLNATDHWRPVAPVFPAPTKDTYFSVWNDVPKRSVDFPVANGSCIPDTVPNTPDIATGVTVSRSGSGQLTVHWDPAPSLTTQVQIRLSVFHPSVNRWDYVQREQFVSVDPSASSYEFKDLTNGRLYRARVTFGNSVGWGRSSAWFSATPAAPPSAPRFRDLFVSGVRTANIHYKWYASVAHGAPVTAYEVAIRRVLADGYTDWVTTRTPYYNYVWYDERRRASYQLRVRALSNAGSSAYLYTRVAT